ncbi:hypothetical protein RAL92_21820 [Metapseudomonas otitidis]|uniref:hypothetical protein n=1 Tax=Metapseudomonas otitidis TaxID=319939 RepID=UPI0032176478
MSTFRASDVWLIVISILCVLVVFLLFMGRSEIYRCLQYSSACFPSEGLAKLVKLYDDKLRSDFFSGFLAVGAFLLSLKTFIVMTMKTSVYDTEDYRKRWQKQFDLDDRIGSRYSGLKQLNDCMFNSILFSLVAAVAQVTIGLVGGVFLVFVSLAFCFISIVYLGYCLFLVKANLDSIIPD